MGPFCGLISNLLIDLSYPMLCGKLQWSIPSLACCPLLPLSVQVCLATSIYQSIINAAIVATTEAEAATWSTMLLPPCARLLPQSTHVRISCLSLCSSQQHPVLLLLQDHLVPPPLRCRLTDEFHFYAGNASRYLSARAYLLGIFKCSLSLSSASLSSDLLPSGTHFSPFLSVLPAVRLSSPCVVFVTPRLFNVFVLPAITVAMLDYWVTLWGFYLNT